MLDGLLDLLDVVARLYDLARLADRISRWVDARNKPDDEVSTTSVHGDAAPRS